MDADEKFSPAAADQGSGYSVQPEASRGTDHLILEYSSARPPSRPSPLSWIGPLTLIVGTFCIAIAMALLMNVLFFDDQASRRPFYLAVTCAATFIAAAGIMWRELARQSRLDQSGKPPDREEHHAS